MLSSRHPPRRWKRRYGFGKVGSRTLPFGAKRQHSPQEWSGGARLRGCTADAKTAFRCHGLATSGPSDLVSKATQARTRTWQLKPKIGIILGTTRPTRFSEKVAQWLANIAERRDDAEFEE